MSEYKETMEVYRSAVEEYLENCFADQSCPQRELFQAMRYSLLAGGKRIRPVLALGFCQLCGGAPEQALPPEPAQPAWKPETRLEQMAAELMGWFDAMMPQE
mgnify:CR=1 FL=1